MLFPLHIKFGSCAFSSYSQTLLDPSGVSGSALGEKFPESLKLSNYNLASAIMSFIFWKSAVEPVFSSKVSYIF